MALGDLYARQGLVAEAKQTLGLVIDEYVKRNRIRDAGDVLRRMAEIDPSDMKVRIRLAELYARDGNLEKAADQYVAIAEELVKKGHLAEALQLIEKALRSGPRSPRLLSAAARVHLVQKDFARAIEHLEEARRAAPADREVSLRLAEACLGSKRPDDARNGPRGPAPARPLGRGRAPAARAGVPRRGALRRGLRAGPAGRGQARGAPPDRPRRRDPPADRPAQPLPHPQPGQAGRALPPVAQRHAGGADLLADGRGVPRGGRPRPGRLHPRDAGAARAAQRPAPLEAPLAPRAAGRPARGRLRGGLRQAAGSLAAREPRAPATRGRAGGHRAERPAVRRRPGVHRGAPRGGPRLPQVRPRRQGQGPVRGGAGALPGQPRGAAGARRPPPREGRARSLRLSACARWPRSTGSRGIPTKGAPLDAEADALAPPLAPAAAPAATPAAVAAPRPWPRPRTWASRSRSRSPPTSRRRCSSSRTWSRSLPSPSPSLPSRKTSSRRRATSAASSSTRRSPRPPPRASTSRRPWPRRRPR